MSKEFKVGDTVWCTVCGRGLVTSIDTSTGKNYPVEVRFDYIRGEQYYTKGGSMLVGGNRCLFFSKPTVTGQTERPFVSELLGKNVIVLSKDSKEILGQGKVIHENNKYITVDWKVDKCSSKYTKYIKEEISIVEINEKNIIKFN